MCGTGAAGVAEELRRWCAVASSHYALRWDGLHRAGRPEAAEEVRRWAEVLDQALHLYGSSTRSGAYELDLCRG